MLQSKLFTKSSKTVPHDADSANARLLTQAGFVERLMAGVYLYLPLGMRVLKNIETIIREEMDAVGGQEIFMSVLAPRENYDRTGRWDALEDILYKFEGANHHELCLNQSHEEIVTPLAKKFVMSYRDLPTAVYQIQTKFRNEARAKSGILRGREFIMKDMYSFHTSPDDLAEYYEKVSDAYFRIFERCGLKAYRTTASGGTFSQKFSHEFQVLTPAGEDRIIICDKCDTAQNLEVATGKLDDCNLTEPEAEMKTVTAKRKPAVSASTELHGLGGDWQVLKSVVMMKGAEMIGICIRGDLELSESKLTRYFGEDLRPARADELIEQGLVAGFISPVGEKAAQIRWVGDESLKTAKNFCTGANQLDMDILDANLGRDFDFAEWGDFAELGAGFHCECGGKLSIETAIEVGNIFDLGTKFSEAFDLRYKDAEGGSNPVYMGCYGIGVTRLMGTIVEVCHDEQGIIWPESVSPFAVHLIYVPSKKSATPLEKATELYQQLTELGVAVLFDDRSTSAGSKFADSDLYGIPTRLVISEKTLADDSVEYKRRGESEAKMIKLSDLKIEDGKLNV